MVSATSGATDGKGRSESPSRSNPMPGHFSCIGCRRRKTKCDKNLPCRNCTKAHLSCTFPPLRSTFKSQKENDHGLQAKVQHLENVVDAMKGCIQTQEFQLSMSSWNPPAAENVRSIRRMTSSGDDDASFSANGKLFSSGSSGRKMASSTSSGRFVRDHGKDVYLSGPFWSSLTAKLNNARIVLGCEDDSRQEKQGFTDMHATSIGFPFNVSQPEICQLHPRKEIRRRLWTIYKENVQPLIPILQLSSTESEVTAWLTRDDVKQAPANLHALLFAVYFAAVSSLEDDDICQEILGGNRQELADRYRAAEEQALARAGLLSTDDVVIIQSLVIYLTVVRCYDASLAWTLSALAFRLVQSLGAHRDGDALSLSPLRSELYKRLSWVICIFECMAADDIGRDPIMLEASNFDSSFPKNHAHIDFASSKIDEPKEGKRWTECTLIVVYAEIASLRRCIHDSRRYAVGAGKSFHSMTQAEKRSWISQCVERFVEEYVQRRSVLDSLEWATATFARTLILEFKLLASRAVERYSEFDKVECDEYFADALECVESAHKLRTDSRAQKWAWLFRSLTQWACLAFLLTDMAARPCLSNRARAWRIAEQAMVSRWTSVLHADGFQWRSMRSLLNLARTARENAVKSLHLSTQSSCNASMGEDEIGNEMPRQQRQHVSQMTVSQPAQQSQGGPDSMSHNPEFTEYCVNNDYSGSVTTVESSSLDTQSSSVNNIQDAADWSLFTEFDMLYDIMDSDALDPSSIQQRF